jgi:hypothetical protein
MTSSIEVRENRGIITQRPEASSDDFWHPLTDSGPQHTIGAAAEQLNNLRSNIVMTPRKMSLWINGGGIEVEILEHGYRHRISAGDSAGAWNEGLPDGMRADVVESASQQLVNAIEGAKTGRR